MHIQNRVFPEAMAPLSASSQHTFPQHAVAVSDGVDRATLAWNGDPAGRSASPNSLTQAARKLLGEVGRSQRVSAELLEINGINGIDPSVRQSLEALGYLED